MYSKQIKCFAIHNTTCVSTTPLRDIKSTNYNYVYAYLRSYIFVKVFNSSDPQKNSGYAPTTDLDAAQNLRGGVHVYIFVALKNLLEYMSAFCL